MMKPSLQDIAAMPFPHSIGALRRHYDREWGKPVSDTPETWTVRVYYAVTSRESMSVAVEAVSAEEAKQLGSAMVGDTVGGDDFEVEHVEAQCGNARYPAPGMPLLDLISSQAVH